MAQMFRLILTFCGRFWPSALVVAVILYGTLTSSPLGDETLPPIPHIDKLIHFLMMGGLTAAVLFDIRRHKQSSQRAALTFRLIAAVAIGVALFSIFDEWLQGQLAIGRPSDYLDGVANIAGIIAASLIAPPVLRAMFPDR